MLGNSSTESGESRLARSGCVIEVKWEERKKTRNRSVLP